ncbi:MAG: YdbL family protein [Chlorobiaceae bacterium]|nr:YdbL family protein [Chlorobiaceae bacterium]
MISILTKRGRRLAVAAIAFMASTVSLPAFAIDLDSARAKGVVGETDSGYLAVPPEGGTEGQELIGTVNAQRKIEYTKVASQNKITPDAVGRMMFDKIYLRIPAGTWVQKEGKWLKKQ